MSSVGPHGQCREVLTDVVMGSCIWWMGGCPESLFFCYLMFYNVFRGRIVLKVSFLQCFWFCFCFVWLNVSKSKVLCLVLRSLKPSEGFCCSGSKVKLMWMRYDPGLWSYIVSARCTKTGNRVYARRGGNLDYRLPRCKLYSQISN